jgi:RES domain-containing protein
VRYEGKLYRTLNPIYAREPHSGRGAALHGGRFNPKAMPALYCSLSVTTAIKEASQAGALQPTTLVSYEADIGSVLDSRDEAALERFGMSAAGLADPDWRDRMKAQGKAPTQLFAETLVAEGFHGLLVQSFARGASDDDLNLVLWKWGEKPPSRLILVDDEGRLIPRA